MSRTIGKRDSDVSKDVKFEVIEVDQPVDSSFDLESWLAEVLVNDWLANNYNNNKG